MAICVGLLGEQEATMTDTQPDTSAKGKAQLSLDVIKRRMKDGEEPIEVLLSLISSPLIDLKGRELAKILTATEGKRPVVLAIIYDSTWDDDRGIVLSVGKK